MKKTRTSILVPEGEVSNGVDTAKIMNYKTLIN